MFPTTIWTVIKAAAADSTARETFAATYRAPVLRYLRRRGFGVEDAEDICQEVFVRIFQNAVLERADSARGRFRGLLLIMTRRVAVDRLRRPGARSIDGLDPAEFADPEVEDPEFDAEWALAIVKRAFIALRDESPGYGGVLEAHLRNEEVDRQKLWIARRKLSAIVRREIALTCDDSAAIEAEVAHLAPFLKSES